MKSQRKDESIVVTIEGLDDLDSHISQAEIALVKLFFSGIDDIVRTADKKVEVKK